MLTEKQQIRAATKRFVDFMGRAPGDRELVKFAATGEIGLVVGELDGITYRVKGHRKLFFHRFKKFDRPLLIVTFDGRQIYTIRGSYRFTQRGFVG